ncbi:MAG TPA: DoxX family protein [Ramlibacter sp.]|uniref:DoxX family protein n=1 Tax=Ramlibacter sp. TaxID=1917967 RepID=UPI002CF4D7A4|nr:DoxX family protein [Ramlibacter sp.]HVZ46863.1 DoxX family protein [Ramlibacter sp.]
MNSTSTTLTRPRGFFGADEPFASGELTAAQNWLALAGRLLIAYMFIPAGWGKLVGFAGTAGYIASKGVPLPEVCAAIAIFCELGLGLLMLFGWKARWAALGLAVFVAVITPVFHNYWAAPEAQAAMQKINFDKNLAIMGGLLALAAFGPGFLSVDGQRRRG